MCSFSANIFSFDRHRDRPFPPICLSHRPCITKKDTAYTFRSSALVGSGKTLGPNKEKQPVPFSGYKPPFDLLSGAKTNLPDSLKPNNTSTSCLQYVFLETASVCIIVQSRVAAALPLRFRTGWYPAVKIAIFFFATLPPCRHLQNTARHTTDRFLPPKFEPCKTYFAKKNTMYQAVRVNHFHPGNSEKPVQNHQNVGIGKGIFAIDIVGRYVIFTF